MFRYLRAYYDPAWRFASRQFLYACLLDLQALKPGNVGLHAEGHGKTCRDYRQSASAAAELISCPNWNLGKRVLKAARATHDVVGCNTNLGILLLSAPLFGAYYRKAPEPFAQRVEAELDAATQKDARDVYMAIRLMQPAGLGQAEEADVAESPTTSLQEAMALAAERDSIAAQYQNGFATVLTEVRPIWEKLARRWGDAHWAMTGAFLKILGQIPDSHIARVHGLATAREVSDKIKALSDEFCDADAPQNYRERLLKLDTSWKSAKISPGSTADLTLAGVLAARLDGWSDDSDKDALSMGDDSQPNWGHREN